MRVLSTIETTLSAGELLEFAVHSANGDKAYCDAMRGYIANEGVPGIITLDVDTDRGLAQLADGNHRANLAASIDTAMPLRVRIRFNSQVKRPYAKGVAWTNLV